MAADLTPDQIASALTKALNEFSKTAGVFSKTTAQANRPKASQTSGTGGIRGVLGAVHGHAKTVEKHANALHGHLEGLAGSADDLMATFKSFTRMFIGGEIINKLISSAEDLSKTYRHMTDIGQTFGGSMLMMSQQAAEAGVPLEEFARMLAKNSTASAIMAQHTVTGGQTMGELSKALRDTTKQYGFYGMSVEDLDSLTSDYSESLREQGRVSQMGSNAQTKGMAQLAEDVSTFSAVTGKSREEILRSTKAALSDVAVLSRQLMNQTSDGQNAALQKTTAFLASIPGETGDMMAKMMTQTFGYGSARFSEEGQTFIEAGAGQILGVFDDLNAKINSGADMSDDELTAFVDQIQQTGRDLIPTLQMQAKGGNDAARKVLKNIQDMQGMSAEQIRTQRDQIQKQKEFTKFFMTIGNTLNTLSGSFREGFLGSIKGLEDVFSGLTSPNSALMTGLKLLGTAVGKLVMAVFTAENIKRMEDALLDFDNVLIDFAGKGGDTLAWFCSSVRDCLGL